ncbi:hypothetical protein FB565_003007 [Actinoplanes lutulentus]|uniref:Uncharacterized protein n=1 Tax=Actinoplanes lutulentus TaxID=1287878 RepID=A0A327Z2X3_9ACTN|nr:hypothetical protein [Actinoplanes lutulentus]RAK28353.1 hypothetical protein B0I29_120121 [Actinoplanes lutulentus]
MARLLQLCAAGTLTGEHVRLAAAAHGADDEA